MRVLGRRGMWLWRVAWLSVALLLFPYVSLALIKLSFFGYEILKTERQIADKKDGVLNMAIERALYLTEDDWLIHPYLDSPRNGWSRWCDAQEVSMRSIDTYKSCRRHIRDGSQCNGWYLTWYRNGDCRRVTLPVQYWEVEELRTRVLDAIKNPCGYLLPPPDPEKIHPNNRGDSRHGEFIHQFVVADYAKCRAGSEKRKGEVIVVLYDNKSGLSKEIVIVPLENSGG